MALLENIVTLEKRIGYKFRNRRLLRQSLVHPSYLQEHSEEPAHNQRLEFLGDAVLHIILAERLFKLYPGEREGALTKRRSILAKGKFLGDLARRLGIDRAVLMSQSEMSQGGNTRLSTLEDAIEALVGAIYLDSDFQRTREVVLKWYGDVDAYFLQHETRSNPKGQLQELVQPELGNDAIRYEVSGTEGEAHKRMFEIDLLIAGELVATGRGASKKAAEEEAASEALRKWPRRRQD